MAECAGIGDIEKARMLALIVKKSFGDSNETYGYRRVHADLVAWGVQAGLELVRSLMRELGLEPCQPKPWRFSLTEGDSQEHDIPDLVNRDFTADAPGEKMADDITCIFTWQGWIYLATVIDCYTRAVIGRAIDDNYKAPLIQQAIEMAARNHPLAAKAIFHSDRGSNYTPGEFAKTMGSSYSASVEAAKTNISLRNLPAITGHITQERGQLLAGRQLGGVSSQLRKHEASPLRLNSYDGEV
jgi:transposase InsO family protein